MTLAGHPAAAGALHAFVLERYPFAFRDVREAAESVTLDEAADAAALDAARPQLAAALRTVLSARRDVAGVPDPTPLVEAADRWDAAVADLVAACDDCLARCAVRASLTPDERCEILRGMVLTRATDNRLKAFFMGGEVRHGGASFQGKGFRSLGQEAIYAAAIRLRRGPVHRDPVTGEWRGDVVAPLIRDLGAALAMRPDEDAVRLVLAAQMGKADGPMRGRDLHIGDVDWGVLPPAAPLAISASTVAGLALAFRRAGDGRVALSFIGEGGSSLGEWHEAITTCAARRLPAVFCIENNQTALSTPVPDQSAARVFADKAAGYGVPGVTVDGTDADEIAAAFAWAVARAREGHGPALIEVVAMRMCGHAHHDDMLFLGKDAGPSWEYPPLAPGGYADADAHAWWRARDPIARYAARLESDGVIAPGDLERMKTESETVVEAAARRVIAAPWPDGDTAGEGVLAGEPPRRRTAVLSAGVRTPVSHTPALPPLEPFGAFDPRGRTFLDAISLAIGDALRSDARAFVFGQDVGGRYGNAFLLLRPLLPDFADRIVNSPLAESGIVGVCVGAALAGLRPIGEIQFNDFVACGFNQLVNNAAKVRYRWGAGVPMVLRMPWGGLRSAGPYHSQNTEAWFYRTPGLKLVAPSTPADARALFAAAMRDPDPVLYFEHIALYRDPHVKQALAAEPPEPMPLGRAALRRAGADLLFVSYGAFVHRAMRAAERLAQEGIEASVLDLRTLAPLDRERLLDCARYCSRVLIVHEDTRTGGIGESLAAVIQEEAFEWLDAPVRILGALDTPVPYAPTLEAAFLPSDEEIVREARDLLAW